MRLQDLSRARVALRGVLGLAVLKPQIAQLHERIRGFGTLVAAGGDPHDQRSGREVNRRWQIAQAGECPRALLEAKRSVAWLFARSVLRPTRRETNPNREDPSARHDPGCHGGADALLADISMQSRSLVLALVLAAASCAGPRTGPRAAPARPSLAVDQDAELGRLADQQVMAEVRALPDRALQTYVEGVLARVAAHADPTASRWTLRLLDSSHVSVRSGPGGYVYVTRGLLAFLGSEAELAAALAHEVAHVSGRDWRRQAESLVAHGVEDGDISKLRPDDRLALLSRLRREEHLADERALEYLERAGYARGGLAEVLGLFEALERLAGGNRVPPSLRTHPATRERLSAIGKRSTPGGEWRKAEYLAKIQGLLFGEDARDGYLIGDRYVVPNADFELPLPAAWRARLVGRDLIAALPGKATILLVARSEHGTLERTLSALGDAASFTELSLGERRAFSARKPSDGGLTSMSYVFDTPGAPLVLALVVPGGEEDSEPVRVLLDSVRKIADPALRNLGTLRVHVVKLEAPSSLRAVAQARPTHTNLSTLALINGVDPDQVLPTGTLIKRIEP